MLIPFCFFLICGYLFFVVSSRSLAKGILIESIKGILFGNSIKANDILWFLLVMFNVRIIGNSIISKPLVFFPIFIIAFIVTFEFHINYFYIGTTFMALPFYLLGNYTKGRVFNYVHWKLSPIMAFLLFMLSVIITNLNGRVSMAGFVYGQATSPILSIAYFYINGILGSLALISLGRLITNLGRLITNKEQPLFIIPAKCAISIVGLQFIPLTIWHKLVGLNQNYIQCGTFSILIMVGCICFHLFVEKKANWILGGK